MGSLLSSKVKIFTAITVLTSLASFSSQAALPPQLPAEAFYQLPLLRNIHLSPNGKYVLALKNMGPDTLAMVYDLETKQSFYPIKSDNKKFKLNWASWAGDDRLLISIIYADKQFGWSTKYSNTRLISIDAHKESKMVFLPRPNDDAEFITQYQDHVLGSLPNEPETIIQGIGNVLWNHETVYKVDVRTGRARIHKREDASIQHWIADPQGTVRAGWGYNDDEKKVVIKVLDPKSEKWVRAWEYTNFEDPSITPMGFGKNPNELYLSADHEGRQAIFKADLSKEGFPKQLMFSSDTYDVEGDLIYSPAVNDVVGIYYNDGGNTKSAFWDTEFKRFQGGLDKALKDTTNYLTSLSDNARRYIVRTSNDTNPGTVWFGDRDTKQLTPIFDLYPQLTPEILSAKEYVTYKARDRLELEGYLSKPKGIEAKNLPLILFPHGGPMSEDGRGFDEFSAFFANRGYAVFQPNFRGSSGRGHDFMMMAVGDMGGAMQDDLEDAVKHLVSQKIVDPNRVCIVGGSYGGYAALMATVKTPDLFKCAISIAGISDVKKLSDQAWHYSNKNAVREQLGNDPAKLKKVSPIRNIEKIKTPILLIHGSDDVIVPVDQSREMAEELKSAKKTYEYIELEAGSHHLDFLPHRQQTFEAMEVFLNKYLPIQPAVAHN